MYKTRKSCTFAALLHWHCDNDLRYHQKEVKMTKDFDNIDKKIILLLPVLIPFGVCVAFLRFLGLIFGLSYKHISVIFNLYIQGTVLLLTSWLPCIAGIASAIINPSAINIMAIALGVCYGNIYLKGFMWMLKHYKLPMDDAYVLCVKDLRMIAEKWNKSYYTVNIIIFIAWYLALIGINVYTAYNIYN